MANLDFQVKATSRKSEGAVKKKDTGRIVTPQKISFALFGVWEMENDPMENDRCNANLRPSRQVELDVTKGGECRHIRFMAN